MAIDTPLKISIVSDYIDRGAKAAQKSLTQVDYAAHKLAKTMGVALSGAAFVYFLKQSTAAAVADTKAQKALANQITNVGLSMQAADIEKYIANMQYTTGVLDDELRPALSKLITLTGSFADSQNILNAALDASKGTGKSLAETVNILSQAYVGNMKGIKQLNLGLTQAEMKAMSFSQILALVQQKYAGATKAQLNAVDLLNVAMADLKEKVGNDFLAGLGIDKANIGADQFKSSMEGIAVVVGGIAKIFGTIAGLAGQTVNLIRGLNPFNRNNWNWSLKDFGKTKTQQQIGLGNYSMTVENAKNLQIQKAQITAADRLKKIEDARLAALKKTNAEAQKKVILDKASAVLAQAQKVFDMDQIQLAAAMMKKQTDEDRARLQLKKDILDLETAINEGNVTAAAKLANAVVNDATLLSQLRGQMENLGNVPNPFDAWLDTIKAMAAELAKLAKLPVLTPTGYSPNTGGFGYIPPAWGDLGTLIGGLVGGGSTPSMSSSLPDWSSAISSGFGAAALQNASTQVTVNVAGSVTTERDLVNAITQGLYNNQASGTPVLYNTGY